MQIGNNTSLKFEKLIPLFLILIFFTYLPVAHADNGIIINTDRPYYSNGDCIAVSGTVKDIFLDQPLLIQIFDSRGNLVEIRQLEVPTDKTYQIGVQSYLWHNAGNYTIKAFYAQQRNQTVFQFYPSWEAPTAPSGIEFDNRTSFFIRDRITNSTVNLKEKSVSFTVPDRWNICRNSERILDITFLRPTTNLEDEEYGSTKILNETDEFVVLTNGSLTDYDVVSYEDYSTLTIPITWHLTDVKIIVKKTVPEFGLVFLVFCVSMILLIALLSKNNLSQRFTLSTKR